MPNHAKVETCVIVGLCFYENVNILITNDVIKFEEIRDSVLSGIADVSIEQKRAIFITSFNIKI